MINSILHYINANLNREVRSTCLICYEMLTDFNNRTGEKPIKSLCGVCSVAQTWNFVGGLFHYTLDDYVMWALESNRQVNEEIAHLHPICRANRAFGAVQVSSALSGFLATLPGTCARGKCAPGAHRPGWWVPGSAGVTCCESKKDTGPSVSFSRRR